MTTHPVISYRRRRELEPLGIFVAIALLGMPVAAQDRGCEVPSLVSTGGPAPRNPHTLAIRWTGYSNFELAYGGQIMLLDAYFDRGSMFAPLGFKADDVKKADVILIGHGHHDHMSDAASVAIRTGAVVVGAPLTVAKLQTQNLDAKQIRTVTGKGDEVLKFGKFEVQPILGRHGQPPANVTKAFNQALQSTATPLTPEQTAEEAVIRSRGTSDPRIVAESLHNLTRANWWFGGAMETYGVNTCNQFPANGSITFDHINVYDVNFQQVTPTWTEIVDDSNAPDCSYAVNATTKKTVITFTP